MSNEISETTPAFVPKYVAAFSCIGSRCADTCCAGWTVALDKNTYKKYQAVDLRRPGLKLRSNIEPFPADRRSEAQFGRIRMDAAGSCPFLNPERLCRVQAQFGSSMLSRTCSSYPRVTRKFGGIPQQSLTPSCPEAARLMFLSREAMNIEAQSLPGAAPLSAGMIGHEIFGPDLVLRTRLFFSEFMRERSDLPIWQRVMAVGLVCATLDEIVSDNSRRQFMDKFLNESLVDDLVQIAGSSVASVDGQASIFGKLFLLRDWSNTQLSDFQRGALAEILEMFSEVGVESDSLPSVMAAGYASGIQLLNEFSVNHSFLMENYLRHLMFENAFPFNEKSWRRAFFKIIAKYGIVRFMLAMKASRKKQNFSSQDFQDCIVVFTRFYEHNLRFKKSVDQLLERFAGLGIIAIGSLIRDDLSASN